MTARTRRKGPARGSGAPSRARAASPGPVPPPGGVGRADAAGLAAAVIGPLALYAATLPRTVVLEDDGLFLMAGVHLGVAHPPGYPLYTLIVHLFTRWPLGDPAVLGHLSSAVAGALACGAVYACADLVGGVTHRPGRPGQGPHLEGVRPVGEAGPCRSLSTSRRSTSTRPNHSPSPLVPTRPFPRTFSASPRPPPAVAHTAVVPSDQPRVGVHGRQPRRKRPLRPARAPVAEAAAARRRHTRQPPLRHPRVHPHVAGPHPAVVAGRLRRRALERLHVALAPHLPPR